LDDPSSSSSSSSSSSLCNFSIKASSQWGATLLLLLFAPEKW